MDRFQQMILMRALMDGDWRSDDYGKRRVMSIEELDAIADFGWHWPDLKGFVTACANVVLSRWRSGSLEGREDSSLVSAEGQGAG
jgi:hypothetical protein